MTAMERVSKEGFIRGHRQRSNELDEVVGVTRLRPQNDLNTNRIIRSIKRTYSVP